jgi:hypothetical protein
MPTATDTLRAVPPQVYGPHRRAISSAVCWSPDTTLQAGDRCHRPAQTRSGAARVHIHYLLSSHTVDG